MAKNNVEYKKNYWMFAKLDALPPRAKQLIFECIYSGFDGFCEKQNLSPNIPDLLRHLSHIDYDECESESEKIFCVAFELFNFMICPDNYDACIKLHKQYPIGKYRADFVIIANENLEYHGLDYKIAIECDGHEYHNKTAEQVLRDRERDVYIRFKGYDVIHFSGTQIFNKPMRCASSVLYALYQEGIRFWKTKENR